MDLAGRFLFYFPFVRKRNLSNIERIFLNTCKDCVTNIIQIRIIHKIACSLRLEEFTSSHLRFAISIIVMLVFELFFLPLIFYNTSFMTKKICATFDSSIFLLALLLYKKSLLKLTYFTKELYRRMRSFVFSVVKLKLKTICCFFCDKFPGIWYKVVNMMDLVWASPPNTLLFF